MEVSKNLKKFELLLKYVFEGKIVITEYHAEKLLKFLEDRHENSPGKLILDTPDFPELILQSFENINNASTSVKVFIIEIIIILFKNELQFTKMQKQAFQTPSFRFCVLDNLNNTLPTNLHLACIKLATVQITHYSGLSVLLQHRAWKNILQPKTHHRPKRVSDAVYNFMAKLVWKLDEYNLETELLEVLGHIIEPITTSGYFKVTLLDSETDAALSDAIFTYLSTLLAVMTEVDNFAPVNRVMTLLKDYFIIDYKLYEIFGGTKNLCLLKLLNTCLFRYAYGILRHLLFRREIDDFCNKMTAFHRNYLVRAMQKREAIALIDYLVQSDIIWSKIQRLHATELNFPLTFERNGKKIDFSLQIIIHLAVPVLNYYVMHLLSKKVEFMALLENLFLKIGKSITDYLFTCCYTFVAILDEGGADFRMRVTTHALKELLRLKGHLNESQAGTLFQSLYYLLEMFISYNGIGEHDLDTNRMDENELRLLTHLLNGMNMLLKEHHISWYENVEIVSIQAELLNLLKQNFLTTKHVVQVLDLIDICVTKFLSPTMLLLVESKSSQSNTMNEIGEVIKLYAQHQDWEVRDSALNLLNTCTEISFIKYMPLQKIIKENGLMTFATDAGLTDQHFYAQCTALKCLTAATKIDTMWQEVLTYNQHVYFQLIYILRNHAEGMVRKEAANALTAIYSNQKLSQNFHNSLYDVMSRVALDDLHWEVQTAALNFWKRVINKHFTYRGMLDGKFPSVTFSKEKRKIIILNEKEIQKQLTAMMNDLSAIGCLTVILECMNEVHNIKVLDEAFGIAKELIQMLDEYNFESDGTPLILPPKCVEIDRDTVANVADTTSEEERNRVIDAILSVNEVELITNLFDNCQTNSEEMDIDVTFCQQRELVNTHKFLESFRSNDYYSLIEAKKKCNVDYTLDGLLDDILGL